MTESARAREPAAELKPSVYLPIRDYALIGDCHGCALVSRSGSIDWCAFRRFDAPPVFCRILDSKKGGFLSVSPCESYDVHRKYVEGTNILCTTFSTSSGRITITDYMPLGRKPRSGVHDYVSLTAPGMVVRTIEGISGCVRLDIAYRPSIDYAKASASMVMSPQGVFTENGPALYAKLPFLNIAGAARAELLIEAGTKHHLVVASAPIGNPPSDEILARLFAITKAYWNEWIDYSRYRGPYREVVLRSALTLKLLTYAPTGAIVAAPTTSLPEEIGGERNWDYRFCWLRDASFTLFALAVLGYSGEAKAFARFLKLVCRKRPAVIQIMYGIGAEMALDEQILEHLDGYRQSRPVRIGNDAYKQRQIDVYGEFIDWAYLMTALGDRFDKEDHSLIRRLVSFAADHVAEPDQGLWESRGAPRHYVYGKMMGWVALDRGIALLGNVPEWAAMRERVREEIIRRGTDRASGHLLQAYDYQGTDAALLLTPMLGFPVPRATLESSVAAIERELRHGDYIERYHTEDGLSGNEGAFLICSFWLVDAYLALGRAKEARELFERLIACANDLGLFAEEIDPQSHAFLGNFPQAFTHLALIGNAINLDLYEKGGVAAIAGTHADRARRAVGATFGWRAIWEACKAAGRVGRFWSSRDSILPASVVQELGAWADTLNR